MNGDDEKETPLAMSRLTIASTPHSHWLFPAVASLDLRNTFGCLPLDRVACVAGSRGLKGSEGLLSCVRYDRLA